MKISRADIHSGWDKLEMHEFDRLDDDQVDCSEIHDIRFVLDTHLVTASF